MPRFTFDAGHGSFKDALRKVYSTSGKRTPEGIPEWEYNNKVVKAIIAYLSQYEDVLILRVDDPTGKTDVPLSERVRKINAFKSDAHCSVHHNALKGVWFATAGGIETLVRPGTKHYDKSLKIAKLVHPKYVKAMGLRDRGIKQRTDLMMISNALNCPSILTEGGFMDSRIDRKAMDNDAMLKAQGEAIAQGYVEYFKLKKKESVKMEVIDLTDGQMNAVKKLAKHGMLTENFVFPNNHLGQSLLTFTTMMAPLIDKLEKNGSL